MLKKRIITALLGIPVVMVAIFLTSPEIFYYLLVVLTLFALWEYTGCMGMDLHWQKWSYLIVFWLVIRLYSWAYGGVLGAYFLKMNGWVDGFIVLMNPVVLALLFWFILVPLILWLFGKGKQCLLPKPLLALYGFIIFDSFIVSLFSIKLNSAWQLLYLLLLVWSADTGAYFVGRRFGKHFLAPKISPKKTWEGLLGGVLLASFVIALFYGLSLPPFDGKSQFVLLGMPYVLVMSYVLVLMSVIGDLFVSVLKRHQGIKDTGGLLPGHGGFLDRIDSLLPAAVIYQSGLIILPLLILMDIV